MTGGRPDRATGGGARPCPICGRPADPARRPFCSQRCADVDLHRWLSESYRISVLEDDAAEEDDDAEEGEGGEEGGAGR